MAAATTPTFGDGLGTVIGSSLAAGDLSSGQSAINTNTASVEGQTQPFVNFGQSVLPTASTTLNNISSTAGTTQGYNDFMSTYTNTPAAQYALQQANAVQNNSAAASGQVLSGANERALGTIDNGIVSTDANNAYNEYLAGNNQSFNQLTSAFGSMLGAVGVGTTATGQDVSATNSLNTATEANAQAQATNANTKGSGLGSMFSGLGSVAAAF